MEAEAEGGGQGRRPMVEADGGGRGQRLRSEVDGESKAVAKTDAKGRVPGGCQDGGQGRRPMADLEEAKGRGQRLRPMKEAKDGGQGRVEG